MLNKFKLISRTKVISVVIVGASALLSACSTDSIVGQAKLPNGVADPELVKTPAGAIRAYAGALARLMPAYNCLIPAAGSISDELLSSSYGGPIGYYGPSYYTYLDSRNITERELNSTRCYSEVNAIRTQTRQAVGLLTDYPSPHSEAYIGHLRAVEAHAQIMLAESYCSGIPLSTVDYNGDYTLKAGSSTHQILESSLTLADSGVAMSADSVRILNFAKITRGRVLLGLGKFRDAANAVAGVPTNYAYQISYTTSEQTFARATGNSWTYTVGNGKGGNGIRFFSNADPRSSAVQIGTATSAFGQPIYYPDKFNRTGTTPFIIASGLEARLIEAEAALSDKDYTTYLEILNNLRRTAISPAMSDTTDPGNDDARLDLLYYERANWNYLTGKRQGDLRRLMRLYGRDQDDVFPSGQYLGATGSFGTAVSMPPSPDEYAFNKHYAGCLTTSE